MTQIEKISLEALLPTGIRLRKGKKSVSLAVQTRKQITENGKTVIVPDFKTVKLDLPQEYTDAEYESAFVEALEEAKKEKVLALKHIATHGVEVKNVKRQGAVATLKEVYDKVFAERWKGTASERGNRIMADDLFAFFPKSISMHELQTWENYDDFITFMEKRIKERKMNNRGTFTTATTNRRLTLIRCCIAYAIKHGLMNKDKVLNPDPEESANYGWKNLKVAKVKDKHALSVEEENLVIDKANELGDEEFAHAFRWLIDVGMRYETEFITFTIKDINWRNKTISFWRGKTNEQSANIPLTQKALEIAKRYKDVALTRKSQRMFSLSKHKIEAMFKKYRELIGIEDFTPYITRTTFGTRLAERGVHPKIISKLMGHECVETGSKYYVQATNKGMERSIKYMQLSDEEFDKVLEFQNSMIGHNSKNK